MVLQYHHIDDHSPRSTSTSPALFRQHLEHIQQQGFKVVPLPQLVASLKAGEALPDRTLAITFDDGYLSVFTEAFPLLRERRWPFTVFVNTKPIDEGWNQFVSWDQLREMAKHGASIANHTVTHDHLVRRRPDESEEHWQDRVWQDVYQAEQRITQETGQAHRLLAYPYGEYDPELLQLLNGKRFTAFGQHSGALPSSAGWQSQQALPRFPMGGDYGTLDDFRLKVATLPLPLVGVSQYDIVRGKWRGEEHPLIHPNAEGELMAPRLRLTLADASVATRLTCFVSGQGKALMNRRETTVEVTSARPLSPGRQRFNCTAPAGKGRFYWFSRPFVSTDAEGNWLPE
ncbi:polysaccharide deacetylase family protein [Pseudomaricurvus alkylphenolicus]|uniref:polysaccharide deacetylase family protein n=1 Tax=Pseudomaricurvus alkylphenolicus TaxID=1306991 RepID=UPI00141DE51B|nr:polysaccharide deacetylase family protein [Pseudomaricurvus alkylphenolicus]